MSDYQSKIKRGHARKKRKLIGTGGYRKLKYGAKRPSYKRSKSAPPGFGVFEESNEQKIVTFDFDETLAVWLYDDYEKQYFIPNTKSVKLMKDLSDAGFEIHIVTSRHSTRSAPVIKFVREEKIIFNRGTKDEEVINIRDLVDEENLHFAGGYKSEILNDLQSKMHFDDDEKEFDVYSRMYPEDKEMKFFHIAFTVDWDSYYNGSVPTDDQISIQRFEQRSEVKHEKQSHQDNRQKRQGRRRVRGLAL